MGMICLSFTVSHLYTMGSLALQAMVCSSVTLLLRTHVVAFAALAKERTTLLALLGACTRLGGLAPPSP
jgi:hypothetical protein